MTQPTKEQIEAAENTDRELWREREGDYYADSIHVTKDGGIGMNVGGCVIVKPIREWHKASLTAAEDVGNKTKALMASGLDALASVGIDGHAAVVAALKQTMAKLIEAEKREAATIEHCAQRLEEFLINSEGKIRDADDLEDYIAAIRALTEVGPAERWGTNLVEHAAYRHGAAEMKERYAQVVDEKRKVWKRVLEKERSAAALLMIDELEELAAAIRAMEDEPKGPAGERGQVGWMGGEGP